MALFDLSQARSANQGAMQGARQALQPPGAAPPAGGGYGSPYQGGQPSMMDQGARWASALQGMGQMGQAQADYTNQMNQQGDIARATAMRNMRTPASMMGQVGQVPTSQPVSNPYAGLLQGMGQASQARGWGVDPRSGQFFVNQGAHPDQQQWSQMMQGLQGLARGGMGGGALQGYANMYGAGR